LKDTLREETPLSAPVGNAIASRRNSTIAAVLGFLWPGVGYLYAGRGLLGLLLLLMFPPAELCVYLLAALVPVPVLCVAIPAVLTLALHVVLSRGAARAASEFPADKPLPLFSRWYSCLTAVVLTAGLSLLWVSGYRTTFVQAFKIPTGAMEPTILIGDRLLVVKWAYGWREPLFGHVISEGRQPKRGEIVVFRFPEDRSRAFLKRCIGLPGETVEVRGRTVLIDGSPLREPYVRFLKPYGSAVPDPDLFDNRDNWGPERVPVGQYFVLGDNRDNSRDSRFWGFLPQEDLLGRAALVYWSDEATREERHRSGSSQSVKEGLSPFSRVRWDRVGRLLE
jgi:signal peptidase I